MLNSTLIASLFIFSVFLFLQLPIENNYYPSIKIPHQINLVIFVSFVFGFGQWEYLIIIICNFS